MRLTNTDHLPLPLAWLLAHDDYSRGESDYTVTELIDPPQKRHLTRLHWDELTEDVSGRIWALDGKTVHYLLERALAEMKAEGPEALAKFISDLGSGNPLEDLDPAHIDEAQAEQRYYRDIEVDGKMVKIGGQFDLLMRNRHGEMVVQDWKRAKHWEIMDGKGPKPERHEQLNILRWILSGNGIQIDRQEVVFLLTDWSIAQAERSENYPQKQAISFFLPMWTDEEVEGFVRQRVKLHSATVPDPCSDKDRWVDPPAFAVIKNGNKKASPGGKHDTREKAVAFASSKGWTQTAVGFDGVEVEDVDERKASIEERKGDLVKRCRLFCVASQVCQQYAGLLAAAGPESEEK